MSTPINAMVSGAFSTAATLVPINLPLPCGFDYIEIVNLSDFADAGATTQVMRAKGYSALPAGYAYSTAKTNGAATLGTETMAVTGGFTFISDSAGIALGAPVVITAVTNATPAVVSSASSVVAGDVVRIYGVTGMQQISGMDFTVTTVNPGVAQTFGFLPAAGFIAAGTAGYIKKVNSDARYYPRRRFITAISAANPCVVQVSVLHDFAVGEKVRIRVPAAFGMPEINGRLATITAVARTLGTGTNSITLDIDASAFTAFAFPTSAIAATGISFPEVVPVGGAVEYPYGLYPPAIDSSVNASFSGVQIGTGVLIASKNYAYVARKGVTV
jgi:hypothetical protein